ncbi:MAG: hypothetical protein IT567_01525 [Alphaproteobacteria bacterium]|nr:hypothetical protein [Alphaproteobacteria bacterium]
MSDTLPIATLLANAKRASQVLACIWTDSFEANPDGTKSTRDFLYSKPSEGLYSSAWAWDSSWHILGNAYAFPERAMAELASLFARQWDNGMIPTIFYGYDPYAIYYPGPEVWENGHSTTSITQPPVWGFLIAHALEVMEKYHPREAEAFAQQIAGLLDSIDRSHRFFRDFRDPLGIGAVSTVHPWENGTDNCPANILALESIEPSEMAWEQGRKKAEISNVTGGGERPDALYYARVFEVGRDVQFVDNQRKGRFNIYDPLMTATLIRSEQALRRLALRFERSDIAEGATLRLAALSQGLERQWDDENQRYSFIDALKLERHAVMDAPDERARLRLLHSAMIPADGLSSYIPLLCLTLDTQDSPVSAARGEAMLRSMQRRGYFDTELTGLPTAPPRTEPQFDPRRYWLGPVWVNLCSLFEEGLKKLKLALPDSDLVQHTPSPMRAVQRLVEGTGECREYYHAFSPEGLGSAGFGWTAVCVLDDIMEHHLAARLHNVAAMPEAAHALQEIQALQQLNRLLYETCREQGLLDKHNPDAPVLSIGSDGQGFRMSIQPAITAIDRHPAIARMLQSIPDASLHQPRPGKLHYVQSMNGLCMLLENIGVSGQMAEHGAPQHMNQQKAVTT